MTYQIEQKIGRHIYIYDVESYWDKNKKQSRQTRKYVGRKNIETGELIPKKCKTEQLKMVYDFGVTFFIEHIIQECKIGDCIDEIFLDDATFIKKLISFQIEESAPLYLFESWHSGVYEELEKKSTSQEISKYLLKIGSMEFERENFISEWVKCQSDTEGIYFDITSFSSYSNLIDLVEWGYNRDGEKLPQINFGVLLGFPSHLPLLYSVHQGSISDVSTIQNIASKLESFKLKNITLVLDRGFYSQSNISEIYQTFDNFIIPMTYTTTTASELLALSKNIASSKNIFYYDKSALYYEKHSIFINENKIFAHVYYDEARKSREINTLMSRLSFAEETIEKRKFNSEEEVNSFLKQNFPEIRNLINTIITGEKISFSRNHDNLEKVINRKGKTIIISKIEMDRDKVLEIYRNRDTVEKNFDLLKNELNQNRMRIHSRKALEGRLFLMFLSIIVRSHISKIMKEQKISKKLSFKELLMELKKLKSVHMINGKKHLTEISKKQKIIFKAFGINHPTANTAALRYH